MTLTDGDVAALARQAVDLLDRDIAIRIDPTAADDPYRRGLGQWVVRPQLDGVPSFGVYVAASWTPVEALRSLVETICDAASARSGSAARPECPGHRHAARVGSDGGDVLLTCPDSGAVVGRITPVVS